MNSIKPISLFLFCLSFQFGFSAQTPALVTERTVSPDTIFHLGSSSLPNQSTVTLTLTTSGDTIFTGSSLDVILVLDRSPSMNSTDGTSTSRIEGARTALLNFINAHLTPSGANSRAAFLYMADNGPFSIDYCIAYDITAQSADPGFVNLQTAINNNSTALPSGTNCGASSQIWDALHDGIDYALSIQRAGVTPILIYLSDAFDFSDEYQRQAGANSVISRLDSINATNTELQVYTIVVGAGDTTNMRSIAEAGDAGFGFSQTGNDLESIFNNIGQSINRTAAFEIDPANTPLLVDVLGPDIHYAGDFLSLGNLDISASAFSLDSTGLYQKVQISIPQIDLADTVQVQYNIQAFLQTPSVLPTVMRTTNLLYHVNDDSSQASRVFYYQDDSVLTWAQLGGNNATPNFIFVLGDPTEIENSATPKVKPSDSRLTIFPQPATPGARLHFSISSTLPVQVFDIWGRQMNLSTRLLAPNSPGIYFLRVHAQGRVFSKRLVVFR